MRPMQHLFRVSGVIDGSRKYASFYKYQDSITYTLFSKAVDLKELTAEDFVELQLALQRDGMRDIKWESVRRKTQGERTCKAI